MTRLTAQQILLTAYQFFQFRLELQKDGKTFAGVVYDVMQDIVYSAEMGSGAFANSEIINVSKKDQLGHSLLVTGFPYNIAERPKNIFELFEAFTKIARGVRRLGSAAIDLCYVATGALDGYWENSLHPWDFCAGKLILEEAGGIVTDFKGNDIDIFSKQILCTNKLIHQQMMDLIKKTIK